MPIRLSSAFSTAPRRGAQGSAYEVVVGPDDRHRADDRQDPARGVEFAIGRPPDQTPEHAPDNRSADAQRNGKPESQRHHTRKEKAREDAKLRARVAQEEAGQIASVAQAIQERLRRGGKLIIFGNGGSATDANDLALDCVLPPAGYRPVPAISLAAPRIGFAGDPVDLRLEPGRRRTYYASMVLCVSRPKAAMS